MQHKDNDQTSVGKLTVPAVVNSELPVPLGLTALRKNRAVFDFTTLRLGFCGSGDCNLDRAVPPGSDSFQLEFAPSGHIVLPCCEFQAGSVSSDHSLTLLSRTSGSSRSRSRSSRIVSAPPPPASEPHLPSASTGAQRTSGRRCMRAIW